MSEDKRIPVTLITGFLGAGKTTLLNQLISENPDLNFAIIENEFGEISIDSELVVRADDGIFELSNGCLCCTLNDELVVTLEKLVNGDYQFDHLLVETTGIAEPDGIAQAFVSHPAVEAKFRLNGTLALADAANVVDMLAEREEARRQISFADVILLSKTDMVEPAAIVEVRALLEKVNPFAEILPCYHGKVAADVLHMEAFQVRSVEDKLESLIRDQHQPQGSTAPAGPLSPAVTPVSSHLFKPTELPINSISFTFDQPFDPLKFSHWVNALLLIQGQNIYRLKGVLHIAEQDHKVILQSVRQVHVTSKGEPWPEGEPRISKLVFIGKGLKRSPLERSLKHCLYKEISD